MSAMKKTNKKLVTKIYYHEKADSSQVQRIQARNPGMPSQVFKSNKELPMWGNLKGQKRLETERGILVLRNQSSWINQFDSIPKGAICRKFWKINAYSGCNFWCEYCYLFKTHWNTPFSTHYVNYGKMLQTLHKVDQSLLQPRLFNSGELGDPLAIESVTGWAEYTIPEVGKMKHVRLLILTKSDEVDGLLNLPHKGKTIISFSLNTERNAKGFEHRTPSPEERIIAGKKAKDAGYPVRVRIDPLFFYPGWREDYGRLVEMIYTHFKPDVITLGEYRPDKGLIGHVKSRFPKSDLMSIQQQLIDDAGKWRFPDPERVDMLKHVKQEILRHDSKAKIAICKESKDVWSKVGLNPSPLVCNCA